MNRREALAATAVGLTAAAVAKAADAPINPRGGLKITKLETFLVKPRWLFLKVHTNAGIVGLGEPIVEGRAETVATAVKEIEPYLIGKDPRQVVHHWQAIYRHAFYRGGPILTSALSGIDMALWDIKGKALGVPVYELLGGPTRQQGARLCPRPHAGATFEEGDRRGLHRVQDRPGQAPPVPRTSRRRPQVQLRRRAVRRAAQGRRRRRRHRHRLPRRDQPGARPSCSSRRWSRISRCSSRSRSTARTTTSWPRSPAARTCRSPPASASSPSGASARCWRRRRRRSCSPTCATPAASPRCG